MALVYHNMSLMLAAGVPLLRSLRTVGSAQKGRLRGVLLRMADTTSQGKMLAETMSENPQIFDPLDVAIVEAAEKSGSLPESFSLLSKWHEFSQNIARKILSGLALPVLLIHAVAFIAPLPTLFLGGWQKNLYLRTALLILLLFYVPAAVVYVILNLTPKKGAARAFLDRAAVKIPVLGKALYNLSISRYCWAFHMLAKAALPVTDCAEKAADSAGNAVVARQVRDGVASVRAGQPVSEGFSSELPAEFFDIWHVGEETGKLEDVTRRLAHNYGQNAEFLFAEFAAWLPRLVYALVCLVIIYYIIKNAGLIAAAIPV
jgi:type II secretory pathway component PulF